jgi:hypothetical protein
MEAKIARWIASLADDLKDSEAAAAATTAACLLASVLDMVLLIAA